MTDVQPDPTESPMHGNPEPGASGEVLSTPVPGAEEPAPAEARSHNGLWNTLVRRLGFHDLTIGEDEYLTK